jgi:hypothetical protein
VGARDVFVGVDQAPDESAALSIVERSESSELERDEGPFSSCAPNAFDDGAARMDHRLRKERAKPISQLFLHGHGHLEDSKQLGRGRKADSGLRDKLDRRCHSERSEE